MFLTDKESGVVLCVSDNIQKSERRGVAVYKTEKNTYLQSTTLLYEENVEVIPQKNTYIDGVVGINPAWVEPVIPTPEPTQMDRIEEMLSHLTSGTISADSIGKAILEGVNEV